MVLQCLVHVDSVVIAALDLVLTAVIMAQIWLRPTASVYGFSILIFLLCSSCATNLIMMINYDDHWPI